MRGKKKQQKMPDFENTSFPQLLSHSLRLLKLQYAERWLWMFCLMKQKKLSSTAGLSLKLQKNSKNKSSKAGSNNLLSLTLRKQMMATKNQAQRLICDSAMNKRNLIFWPFNGKDICICFDKFCRVYLPMEREIMVMWLLLLQNSQWQVWWNKVEGEAAQHRGVYYKCVYCLMLLWRWDVRCERCGAEQCRWFIVRSCDPFHGAEYWADWLTSKAPARCRLPTALTAQQERWGWSRGWGWGGVGLGVCRTQH